MTTPDEVAALVKQARSYLASCAPHILERTGPQYLVKTVTALESLSPPAGMVIAVVEAAARAGRRRHECQAK